MDEAISYVPCTLVLYSVLCILMATCCIFFQNDEGCHGVTLKEWLVGRAMSNFIIAVSVPFLACCPDMLYPAFTILGLFRAFYGIAGMIILGIAQCSESEAGTMAIVAVVLFVV